MNNTTKEMQRCVTMADVWEALEDAPRGANIWLWTGQGWKGPMPMRDIEDMIDKESFLILSFKKERPTALWEE